MMKPSLFCHYENGVVFFCQAKMCSYKCVRIELGTRPRL